MFITDDLGEQIMREIDASSRKFLVNALNLNPPGGFIGYLPQTRVLFDPVESADPTISVSGNSLLTNLNRIRAGTALGSGIIQLRHLASGLIIPTDSTISIQDTGGSPTYTSVDTIRFTNATVEELSPGLVNITFGHISASGIISSGLKCYGWYIDGAVSPLEQYGQVHKFNNPYVIESLTFYTQNPATSTSTSGFIIISADDGATWNDSISFAFPAGSNHYSLDVPDYTVDGGMLVGLKITTSGYDVPDNLNIIMNGIDQSIGTNGTVPIFTPKRVPYAGPSGILTESARLNHLTADAADILIIGSDHYTNIGGSADKVGLDIVREEKDGGLILETFSNGSYSPSIAGLRARGTQDIPEPLLTNDVIFRFTGRGYAISGWANSPRFRLEARATEDWTPTAQGSKAIIGITKLGETSTSDMFQVDDTGILSQGIVSANTDLIGAGLQITGGTPGIGKSLIDSDGAGTALWDTPNIFGYTYPDEDAWTGVNVQGGTYVLSNNVLLFGTYFNSSASTQNCGIVRPASGDFTLKLAFGGQLPAQYASEYGIMLRESSSGKLITITIKYDGSAHIRYWDDDQTVNSTVNLPAHKDYFGTVLWMQILNLSPNRRVYIGNSSRTSSASSYNILTESISNFITPDQVGVCVQEIGGCGGVTSHSIVDLYSWSLT